MADRHQEGFTIFELVVVLAVIAVIAPVITIALFQVLSVNTLTSNHLTAVKQVESAIYRIGRDAQVAQTIQTGGSSGFPLNLVWVEWDSTSNNVTYTLQNGELWRACSVNGSPATSFIVAQNISSDASKTNLEFASGVLTVKITAALGGFRPTSETRLVEVFPKAAQ